MPKTVQDCYKKTKRNRPTAKAAVTGTAKNLPQKPNSKSDEELLRDFDLTLEYGPCIGISRLERWQRAAKHGLNPPSQVKDIIMKHLDDTAYTQSLWNDYNI